METIWLYFFSLLSLSLPFFLLILNTISKPRRKLPPSPFPSIPILGHLHHFKPPILPNLRSLSQKLGPIFSLNIGRRLMVVVTSHTLADECFTKNDVVLAARPRSTPGKYIGYNHSTLVLASYGDHWRHVRRLASLDVFSPARLNAFQAIRHDEMMIMLRKMHTASSEEFARVELRQLLSDVQFNNIMRMVAGKRYHGLDGGDDDDEAAEFRELERLIFANSGGNHVKDFFPFMKWFDLKGAKKERELERIAARIDASMQKLIDEQRRSGGGGGGDTMIKHFLGLQPDNCTDEIIKPLILVMLEVGVMTTLVTTEWAMSALLNHPNKIEKARAEIDSVVGKDRLVNESDLPKLSYLQQIISEALRLNPAAPFLVAHEASADCKIGGYDVPRGAILIVNAWAIHRDPSIWEDPDSFKPERFEGGAIGPPRMLPFGMGRRSCPGYGLANRVMGLAIGSLIQCFDWERVDEKLLDMSVGKGGSMARDVPLVAKCRARDHVGPLLLPVS